MKSDEILARWLIQAANGYAFSELCPQGRREFEYECEAKDCYTCLLNWARKKADEKE